MKKIIACILFVVMLISTALPISIYAETPEDYSESLVGYWDFEGKVDKGGATNNTIAASNTNATFSNGRGVIKNVAGAQFAISAVGATSELSNTPAVTLGFKMMLTKQSTDDTVIVHRGNAFQVRAKHDATNDGYKLYWINDGLQARDICYADANGKAVFEYGTEYYFFFVVVPTQDASPTNTVTMYWSTDGKSFTSATASGVQHFDSYVGNTGGAYVQPGEIFRYNARGANILVGQTTAASVNGAEISIDTIWYYTAAVAAESIPVVALHKINNAGNEATGAPAYRGCQTSAVSDNKFTTRFIATVDSVNYKEVGFEIQVTDYNGASGDVKTYSTTTVYESIIGCDAVGGSVVYTAEELGGTYVYALSVSNIRVAHPVTMRITPYYVAFGSTEPEYSTSYDVTVYNGSVISQTVYNAPVA